MKKILSAALTTFILISCTGSNDKNMTTTESKKRKQDSISGYAPVNGLKMYYEIHGEGSPLVLVHGGGSTIQTSFGNILPLLSQHHKVIAVELQAHGHTADRDSPESFEQDADDVAALLNYLKINKADLLGFSNGGNTIMRVATRHPELVNKLVIISAFYKRKGMMKGFFEGMVNANLGNMPGPLKDAYLKINNDSVGLQRMFERDKTRMVTFKDWNDEDLTSIKASSLVIAGDKDVTTAEHTVKMSQLIPNAQLMILPGIHGECIGEICAVQKESKVPVLTVAVIEEFLGKSFKDL